MRTLHAWQTVVEGISILIVAILSEILENQLGRIGLVIHPYKNIVPSTKVRP
jgi:hypothetical protein